MAASSASDPRPQRERVGSGIGHRAHDRLRAGLREGRRSERGAAGRSTGSAAALRSRSMRCLSRRSAAERPPRGSSQWQKRPAPDCLHCGLCRGCRRRCDLGRSWLRWRGSVCAPGDRAVDREVAKLRGPDCVLARRGTQARHWCRKRHRPPDPARAPARPGRPPAQPLPNSCAMLASSHPLIWLESLDVLRSDSDALPSNRSHFKHRHDERRSTGRKKQAKCDI